MLRGAPGGEAYAGLAERVREVLQDLGRQDLDQRDQDPETTRYEEKIERIEEGVQFLTEKEIPELRDEIRRLRELLNAEYER